VALRELSTLSSPAACACASPSTVPAADRGRVSGRGPSHSKGCSECSRIGGAGRCDQLPTSVSPAQAGTRARARAVHGGSELPQVRCEPRRTPLMTTGLWVGGGSVLTAARRCAAHQAQQHRTAARAPRLHLRRSAVRARLGESRWLTERSRSWLIWKDPLRKEVDEKAMMKASARRPASVADQRSSRRPTRCAWSRRAARRRSCSASAGEPRAAERGALARSKRVVRGSFGCFLAEENRAFAIIGR
jgi:hypothetical protein